MSEKKEQPHRDIEIVIKYDGLTSFLEGEDKGTWVINMYPQEPLGLASDEWDRAIKQTEMALRTIKSRAAEIKRKEREKITNEIDQIESEINTPDESKDTEEEA